MQCTQKDEYEAESLRGIFAHLVALISILLFRNDTNNTVLTLFVAQILAAVGHVYVLICMAFSKVSNRKYCSCRSLDHVHVHRATKWH